MCKGRIDTVDMLKNMGWSMEDIWTTVSEMDFIDDYEEEADYDN